ncbi:HlyD family efflux transporter periplasmic adaptor subunit [Alicyclobacillus cycloheptanicus]|uniref:Multidrug resistance efflux pump n=1 Tax=Alicyclobacillus cycloheptanicus TaxID=1457 RepID=A0ABT9XE88_9BACL|nr:HlyD family efflux transporter periplasmic adaptor subunit [Alicyclobacillus cycloheptanicus]MDQ0188608.1 multidrug resistance efflux pump [Alicyclobacillus cycloheptanicus]WDM00709.1 HlyD family efflux transporter periplasmic adaptor subunit [Alicyclobacillus cycloheptanicus]
MRARQLVILNIVIIIVVVALAGFGYWYFYNQNQYVTENDAAVTVNAQNVIAPANGKLTKWTVSDGTSVSAGDVIGVEQLPTGQTVNITTPIGGQVLKSNAVANEVVPQGDLLAVVANLNDEYIVANLKETEVRHVAVGDTVDIYLDAYPGTTFSGTVTRIGSESAAETSPYPSAQSSGNFQKEVQRIPVYISLDGKQGKYIVPNMNARVRIHRTND